jgi:hypothetical protein
MEISYAVLGAGWRAKEADGGDFPQEGENSPTALAGEGLGLGELRGRFADRT